MVFLALRSSAEVSISEDNWSHKGPDVEEEADPARADFDPHSRPLAGYHLELRIRAKKTEECQVEEPDISIEQPPSPGQEILQGNLADTIPK